MGQRLDSSRTATVGDYRIPAVVCLLVFGGFIAICDGMLGNDELFRRTLTFWSGFLLLAIVPYLLVTADVRKTFWVCSFSTGFVYLSNFILFGDAYYFAIGFSVPIGAAIFMRSKDAVVVGLTYVVVGSCIGLLLHVEVLRPLYEARPVSDKTVSVCVLIAVMACTVIWKERLFQSGSEREAQSRVRFETICDNGYGALLEADDTGKIVFSRGRFLQELGFSAEDLLGRNQFELISRDVLRVVRRNARFEDGEVKYDLEIPVLDAEHTSHWVRLSGGTIHDRSGRRRWVSAIQDIAAEVEKRQRDFETSRVDSLANFSAGISHEFNNLLTAIGVNADRIGSPEIRQEILRAQRQASELTAGLLTFARKQGVKRKSLVASEFFSYAKSLIMHRVSSNIDVHWKIDANYCVVMFDPGQLEDVLCNLASNACQAMPDGGQLFVSATQKYVSNSEAAGDSLPNGDFIEIVFRDTGYGMDVETVSHAVEPLFTTKPRGALTGMGLATAHGMIRSAGGSLRIKSAKGQGTEVTILLPVLAEKTALEPVRRKPYIKPPIGNENVVVLVEDREVVAMAISMLLDANGFRVHVHADAESAWEQIDEGMPFDLLISDIVLPGISGVELLHRSLVRRPGLRSILISGHQRHDLSVVADNPDTVRYIAKPFESEHLLSVVCELLECAEPTVKRLRAS